MNLHNFNSGPSILPPSVLTQAAAAILDFNQSGLSLLEIGHRTDSFKAILEEAISLVKKLMGIGDDYEVLFLHGGATTQFMQVPMNLLEDNATAAYCDNGIWGNKAWKEAKHFGNIKIVSDSSTEFYRTLPQPDLHNNQFAYLHVTTNNTVEGTQWHTIPSVSIPIVADMSSDIFSRPTPFNRYSLMYAGAQKNMGAAGVNLVVVKKEILGKISRKIPTIMDYLKHIDANSLMNTPPVFAVYVSLLTLRWIVQEGGLEVMGIRNEQKSTLLYNTLDKLPVFSVPVAAAYRSQMNVVFFLSNPRLEADFLTLCKENGMIGVKGYRTVGGIRASLYNALPLESVQSFCSLLQYFATKNG